MVRYKIIFSGYVQGVGFRWRVKHCADMYGVTGYVKNLPDTSVLCEMQGEEEEIQKAVETSQMSGFAEVTSIEKKKIPIIEREYGFEILR